MLIFATLNDQIMYYYKESTIFQFMIQKIGLPVHNLTTVNQITKIHMHDTCF